MLASWVSVHFGPPPSAGSALVQEPVTDPVSSCVEGEQEPRSDWEFVRVYLLLVRRDAGGSNVAAAFGVTTDGPLLQLQILLQPASLTEVLAGGYLLHCSGIHPPSVSFRCVHGWGLLEGTLQAVRTSHALSGVASFAPRGGSILQINYTKTLSTGY